MTALARRPLREQNILALLLLLLLLALLAGGLFGARGIAHQQAAHLQDQREELGRLRQAARLAPALAEARSKLETLGEEGASLLSGGSAALAGAQLQSLLGETVSQAGGRVESSLLLPPEEDGRFLRVPVRVSASMTVEQLQRTLFAIETGQPLLFIESLNSEQANSRRRDPQDQKVSPPLRVSLTVSGYLAAGNGEAAQ